MSMMSGGVVGSPVVVVGSMVVVADQEELRLKIKIQASASRTRAPNHQVI